MDAYFSWNYFKKRLVALDAEDLIEKFGFNIIPDETPFAPTGESYNTFNKTNAWISILADVNKRIIWRYKGNEIFHFRLPRGSAYYRPEHDTVIELKRTIDNVEMVLKCRIDLFYVHPKTDVGNKISKSCGVAMLHLLEFNILYNEIKE